MKNSTGTRQLKILVNHGGIFFLVFNHVKSFVTKRIARQLCFACIYSKINYGIKIIGSCSKQLFSKIQGVQNKVLKFLLNLNRHTLTMELHTTFSILKVDHIIKSSILLLLLKIYHFVVLQCIILKCYFWSLVVTYWIICMYVMTLVPLEIKITTATTTTTNTTTRFAVLLYRRPWNKYFVKIIPVHLQNLYYVSYDTKVKHKTNNYTREDTTD